MSISHPNELKRGFVAGQVPVNGGLGAVADADVQGLNISGFLRIVKQQWPLITLMTLLALLAASAYVFTATTSYSASSKILINPQPKRVFGSDYIPQDGNTNQILIESQTRVIASNAVLARVVKSEKLTSDPEFVEAIELGAFGWVKKLFGFETPATQMFNSETELAVEREALRRLNDRLAVKRPSQTYVVEVSVSSRDPEKAARLSRAVAKAYIADQAQTQADATRQISVLLQDRLEALRNKVHEADSRVQLFKERNNIVETSGSLVNERHLSRLNDELLAAQNRMVEAATKADKVRALIGSGVIPETFDEAIKSRLIATLREQYATTARRESQLASVLGDRHPQLIAARARVTRSKSLINDELKRIAGSLQADADVERKRVASLEKRLGRSRDVTDSTNKARVELAGLEREANASRAVYERVLAKARESNAEEKLNLVDARIISYASTPLWASWPKKKIILPLALLLGLGVGVAGALVNDFRQDRFISGEDMERMTGLRMLGTLPSIIPRPFASLRDFMKRGKRVRRTDNSYYRLYLELSKIGSPYATAVMGLVRNLLKLSGPHGSHSVMFVSSKALEGSSSIAWSTAISAAMQNQKVLLVDGDGGNGELAETLSPGNHESLRTVLAGKSKLTDHIAVDRELGLSFLSIVPAGKGKQRPINWSDYQTLLTQLPEITKNYDLVLVDGGAILNSGLAHLLVDFVDDVALVVRTDGTSRKTVLSAMKALDVPMNKMAGVVVSSVDPETV